MGGKGETTMEIDLDVGINEIADRGQESSPCCHSGKLCWVTEHFIFVVEQQQATVEGLGIKGGMD